MSIIATGVNLSAPTRPLGKPGGAGSCARQSRDPAELCRLLALPADFADAGRQASGDFPLLAPRPIWPASGPATLPIPYCGKFFLWPPNQPPCPAIRTTRLPRPRPNAPGPVAKYPGRALLVTTGACAVHCRYCFRRHFPYSDAPKSLTAWEPALAEIAADASLHEILLSGGDPLTMVDGFLAELAGRLASIAHVRRLRIHTRLPIVIPSRVSTNCSRGLPARD